MKIIWIDGTFGIGKSAVAAAIVKKIPQAHLLEFDALQENISQLQILIVLGEDIQKLKNIWLMLSLMK